MDIKYILEDQCFLDFAQSRDLRKSTIKEYSFNIKNYCNFLKKTPTEFIEEAEDEQEEKRLRMKNRKIKRDLLSFHQFLKDKNHTYQTIKKQLSIVKTFYREYDIEIPRMRIGRDNIEVRQLSTDIPGQEDIKIALSNCNKKYQAIILLMSSSGMGMAEIRHLTVQDFKNSLNYKGNIREIESLLEKNSDRLLGWWHGPRYKTTMNYFTYSSPESTKAIIDYLSTLPKPLDDNDPLFPTVHKSKMISESAFVDMFQVIDTRCKFPRVSKKKRFFSSHKLRKFFGTTLISCKIQKLYADWLLGHKIPPQDEAYFKANPGSVKSEYLKALPYLTITEKVETRIVTDERLLKLEDRLSKLEEENKMLKIQKEIETQN